MGLLENLFMFWLHRHLLAKQVLNSKQSTKGYERIIQEILIRSGYFSTNASLLAFSSLFPKNMFITNDDDDDDIPDNKRETWQVQEFLNPFVTIPRLYFSP